MAAFCSGDAIGKRPWVSKRCWFLLVEVDEKTTHEDADIVSVNEKTVRHIISHDKQEDSIVRRPCGGHNNLKLTPESLDLAGLSLVVPEFTNRKYYRMIDRADSSYELRFLAL